MGEWGTKVFKFRRFLPFFVPTARLMHLHLVTSSNGSGTYILNDSEVDSIPGAPKVFLFHLLGPESLS